MDKPKILIVGAGIAGLALYRALRRHQLDADIIEKKFGWVGDGGGLCLPANAVAGFDTLGLKGALMKRARRVRSVEYAQADGTTLATASLEQPPLNCQPFLALPRDDLMALLQGEHKGRVRFGLKLRAISQDSEGVDVHLSDGSGSRYNLVVGADGLFSQTREMVFKHPGVDELGVSHWRFVVPMATDGLEPVYYIGNGEAFMLYPIAEGQVYCCAQAADRDGRYLGDAPRRVLSQLFGHYAPHVREALSLLDERVTIFSGSLHAVHSREVYRGRVALVGDALHACPPILQQGVGQSLEDVLALAALLTVHPVDKALAAYKAQRLPRVRWVIDESNRMTRMAARGRFRLARVLRDRSIRRSGPVNVAGWRHLLKDPAIL